MANSPVVGPHSGPKRLLIVLEFIIAIELLLLLRATAKIQRSLEASGIGKTGKAPVANQDVFE